MKELCGLARNISYNRRDDGTWRALIEAIIMVSEPAYRVDQSGDVVQMREVSRLRFGANPDGLRHIAKVINEWADDAEKDAPAAAEPSKPHGPAGE
jgi:hypothetical protein